MVFHTVPLFFEPSYEEFERQATLGLWINLVATFLIIVSNGWYVGALLSWLRSHKKFLGRHNTIRFSSYFVLLVLALYLGLGSLFVSQKGQQETGVLLAAIYMMVFLLFAPPVIALISLLVSKIRKRPVSKVRRFTMIGALSQLSVLIIYSLIAYLWWPTR